MGLLKKSGPSKRHFLPGLVKLCPFNPICSQGALKLEHSILNGMLIPLLLFKWPQQATLWKLASNYLQILIKMWLFSTFPQL
jgi:hypothetical protein